jgi:pre-mRNA-splicing helicase BRR2
MAVDSARSLQYEYKATSNLVLQADRSLIDKRGRDEATGEVQTLVGKLTGTRMGDRAERTRPPVPQADTPKKKKSRRTSEPAEDYPVIAKGSSLLSSEMEELSGVYYRPRTRETKSTYEILLSFIQKMIGDQVYTAHASYSILSESMLKFHLCIPSFNPHFDRLPLL